MFDFKRDRFFVYDFETEGLNQAFSRPWDIAWSLFENGKCIENKQYYVHWGDLKMSHGAAKATGFDKKKEIIEKHGLKPEDALALFDELIYDESTYNVGHNILGYDSQIHNVARRCIGLPTDFSFIKRSIDTNAIARGIKLERLPKDEDDFIAWQYKILDAKVKGLKTRIGKLCGEYSIPYEEDDLHSAAYDVEKNVEIFKRQLNEIEINI